MQKRKLLILTATTLAIVASSLTISNAYAQSMGNPQEFAKDLAQKLGIEESKVQQALNEIQKTHQAEIQAREDQRLTQLVKDGKITEAQKQLILNKRSELKRIHESEDLQNLSHEERKAKFQEMHQELESWAEENGIDIKYLMKGFGVRKMMGPPPSQQ